ncbi:hypothetical protein L9F63_006802, partial [Diploptera punctata]
WSTDYDIDCKYPSFISLQISQKIHAISLINFVSSVSLDGPEICVTNNEDVNVSLKI